MQPPSFIRKYTQEHSWRKILKSRALQEKGNCSCNTASPRSLLDNGCFPRVDNNLLAMDLQ